MTVPTGTPSAMSAPLRPVRLEPSPWPPRPASNSFWNLKLRRVLRLACAVTYTEPPAPPSPPLGPPRGTNFSRRKLMAPRPPCPAATWISTSSTNIILRATASPGTPSHRRSRGQRPRSTPVGGPSARSAAETQDPGDVRRLRGWLLDRVDADDAAAGAVVLELHPSSDLRKQRVVLAEADVQARPETAAALPHEDRPAGHDVAVEPLDAQP